MAKTDVYSWRISRSRKAALEHVAREQRVSMADLLDRVTGEWMARSASAGGDAAEQARLHAVAARHFGTLGGGDPDRSSEVRQRIRADLMAGSPRARRRRGR
jgi:hypothetical protein